MKLSEQLRRHLESSGHTMYAVSQQTGISQSGLSRFRSGERILSWDAADKLGELLGLEIVAKAKKRKGADRG